MTKRATGGAARADKVALWWTDSSLVWLLAIFVAVLIQSRDSLRLANLAELRVAALIMTAALAALGTVGVALFRRGIRIGVAMLGVYSVLWIAGLAAGLWWASSSAGSVCLAGVGVCITTAHVTAITAAVAVPFMLLSVWSWRRLHTDTRGRRAAAEQGDEADER